MKRWIRASIITTTCLVPVGFVVGFATDWSHKTPISCVGSSGVKPFVEHFGNKYSKSNKQYDVTVDAGGSGFGITQIANQYCNIGDASKNPYEGLTGSDNQKNRDKWKSNQIKTITIGWEAICMVWIPPKDLELSWNQRNSLLSVDEQNIDDLMRVFSGFDAGHSLAHYGTLGEFCHLTTSDIQNKLNKQVINPYVRAGGATTSGTAASFYKETQLPNATNTLNDDQKKALESGKYGKDRKVYDTDEANSRAWEMFRANNIPGSMVYLSSGFVIPNLNLIKDAGYGVMGYEDSSFFSSDSNNPIADGYDWLRPLNIMLSLKNTEKEKDFIDYIFDDQSQDDLAAIGGKKLNLQQLNSMVGGTNFETQWMEWDDVKLASIRYVSWTWDNRDTIFGAKFNA